MCLSSWSRACQLRPSRKLTLAQLQTSSQGLCGMRWACTGSAWRAQRRTLITALPAQHAQTPPGHSSSAGLQGLRWLHLPHPLLKGWEAPVQGRQGNTQAVKVGCNGIPPDMCHASECSHFTTVIWLPKA